LYWWKKETCKKYEGLQDLNLVITQTYIFWALYFIPPWLNVKKIWLIVKFYCGRKEEKNLGKYEVLLVTEHSVVQRHGIDTT
jgi:hypothetical protein